MPSTSGRAATYPRRADKLKFFYELKEQRDKLRSEKGLQPADEVYTNDVSNDSSLSSATQNSTAEITTSDKTRS